MRLWNDHICTMVLRYRYIIEWEEAEGRKKARAIKMPDEEVALKVMFEAYLRLKELGFNDAMYCPKDGTPFNLIEAGSVGIHVGHYLGDWPTGGYLVHDGGDLWPSHPVLFRLIDNHE